MMLSCVNPQARVPTRKSNHWRNDAQNWYLLILPTAPADAMVQGIRIVNFSKLSTLVRQRSHLKSLPRLRWDWQWRPISEGGTK
jgi:hypothetical protein